MPSEFKRTLTICIPEEMYIPAKKHLRKLGLSLSGWVSDRLHTEMKEDVNKKGYS